MNTPATARPTLTGDHLRQHFGVKPIAPLAPTYRSATHTWEWTRGVAYRVRNLDWPQDVIAMVVDDFGNLTPVAWWCDAPPQPRTTP